MNRLNDTGNATVAARITLPETWTTLREDLASMLGIELDELDTSVTLPAGVDGFHLMVDELAVLVHARPLQEPATVRAVCEFGLIPPEREERALRQLMAMNFVQHGPEGPVYAREPASGAIVLHLVYRTGPFNARTLLASLGDVAVLAREWRQTHFLDTLAERNPGAGVRA